ncbi:hypothetical protein [Paenibacillus dendritiformis]|uniref:hypothetical protein n=1 Tax=Paenibacillus dendritiformis TaxID=130049 RepID=UPI001BCBC951|nr:hypothetical protein [Paenibacillus dendritiformis]
MFIHIYIYERELRRDATGHRIPSSHRRRCYELANSERGTPSPHAAVDPEHRHASLLGFADRDQRLPRMPDRLAGDGEVHFSGVLSRRENIIIRCTKRLAALQIRIEMILSALDELNAKSVADGFFICSAKAALSPDTLFTCSTNTAKMQQFH